MARNFVRKIVWHAALLLTAATALAAYAKVAGGGQHNSARKLVLLPEATAAKAPGPAAAATPAADDGWSARLAALRPAIDRGAARAVVPLEVAVTTQVDVSAFAEGTAIRHDDPRLRLMGGRWAVATRYPRSQAAIGQAIQSGDPAVIGGWGLPEYAYGINNAVEFTLPPGQREFELVLLSGGARFPLYIAVDGAVTNGEGYDVSYDLPGTFKYTRIVLPAAADTARVIRLSPGSRPLAGLRFPAGQSLGARPDPAVPLSVVFEGDSITEGTGAGHSDLSFALQASYRLGIGDPVIVGIGGSGYLRRRPAGSGPGLNYRERIANVTAAIAGRAPQVAVIAGGTNDCGVAGEGPSTPAMVGAEARAYFQALRSAAPDMVVLVVGPFTGWSHYDYSPQLSACRDAIFAAAATVPGTYPIDVSKWLDRRNRDWVFSYPADPIHPTAAGHALYGQLLADAVLRIVNRGR